MADIEVVAVRDPSGGIDITVFDGGRNVTNMRGVRVYVIDPDTDQTPESWNALRDEALATASADAAAHVRKHFDRFLTRGDVQSW